MKIVMNNSNQFFFFFFFFFVNIYLFSLGASLRNFPLLGHPSKKKRSFSFFSSNFKRFLINQELFFLSIDVLLIAFIHRPGEMTKRFYFSRVHKNKFGFRASFLYEFDGYSFFIFLKKKKKKKKKKNKNVKKKYKNFSAGG